MIPYPLTNARRDERELSNANDVLRLRIVYSEKAGFPMEGSFHSAAVFETSGLFLQKGGAC